MRNVGCREGVRRRGENVGYAALERKEDRVVVLDHWIWFVRVSHGKIVMSQRARRATTRDYDAATELNSIGRTLTDALRS